LLAVYLVLQLALLFHLRGDRATRTGNY